MPVISVIVPVYNVEKYLHRCVDSILAQTFTDFELILVDDGSPDNCGIICDKYAEKDNRIHVIHKENGGLSSARNAGIDWAFENSESEWITFIDSDDWIHPKSFEHFIYLTSIKNVDIVFSPIIKMDTYKNKFPEFESGIEFQSTEDVYLSFSKKMTDVSACGKLYRKYLFKDIRFPIGRLWEDLATTYKLFLNAKICGILKCNLYYYFVNNDGIVCKNWRPKRLDELKAYEEMLDFFKSNEEYHDLYIAYQEPYIKAISYSYYMCIHSDMPKKEIDYYGKLLSKKMRKALCMYKKNTSITFADNKGVYETAHPRLMQAYYISNVLRERLKKGK